MATKITFSVYDWRDLMKAATPIVNSKATREKILTKYLCFNFADQEATVYVCNGVQLLRARIPAKWEEPFALKNLLIPPAKIPARTRSIEMFIDGPDDAPNTNIAFIDDDNDIIDSVEVPFVTFDVVDYAGYFNMCLKKVQDINLGDGRYQIAVNPSVLLDTLQGFKDAEAVVLNFAEPSDGFIVTPTNNYDFQTVVLPVRIA